MTSPFRTVWLLAAINAIAMSCMPMMMLIGSIIGAALAPAEQWATLPIALMIVGTALAVIPATRCMQRLGRRNGFALFIVIGFTSCLVLGQALAIASFALFCAGALGLGVTTAAMQQIRFAAMESVELARAPTAASLIMCAGIVAAIIGPELAVAGRHLDEVEYRASFWLGSLLMAIGGAMLLFYRPAKVLLPHDHGDTGRSSSALLRDPGMLLAVVSGASAFMVMSFVMTATPVSMHLHHGHSLEDTKWVIQSHIAAMFLPSLVTPLLFRLLGIKGLMYAGLACYTLTIAIGLVSVSAVGFWGQLVMLGIGWNFLFVAGTALLPMTYREGEQFRAQALNDFTVFSCQALASLSAGWAITLLPWQGMLLVCLAPMALLLLLLLIQRRS